MLDLKLFVASSENEHHADPALLMYAYCLTTELLSIDCNVPEPNNSEFASAHFIASLCSACFCLGILHH